MTGSNGPRVPRHGFNSTLFESSQLIKDRNNPGQGQQHQHGLRPTGNIPQTNPSAQYPNTGMLPPSSFATPYQPQYSSDPSGFAFPNQQPQRLQQQIPYQHQLQGHHQPPVTPSNARKRRFSDMEGASMSSASSMAGFPMDPPGLLTEAGSSMGIGMAGSQGLGAGSSSAVSDPGTTTPVAKKGRTNTPWTPAEEQRLKMMREAGNSWSEIAKSFPSRTEGSVKKHWYKDMHYAEFAEDEGSFVRLSHILDVESHLLTSVQGATLLNAIKEYEASKWKVIGQKVGKPAKACEQYAKEHFKP